MHCYVMLGIGVLAGILLGRAFQLVVDLRRFHKIVPMNPLCGSLEKCQERMRRECDLSYNLGHLQGSVEGSRRAADTLMAWGQHLFRPKRPV